MKINQPATGGAKQMMQKRTPVASGGKAGTVGKYSSEGGRGDVGKRSYDGTKKRTVEPLTQMKMTATPIKRQTTTSGTGGVSRRGEGLWPERAQHNTSQGMANGAAAVYAKDFWDEDHQDHIEGTGGEGKFYRLTPPEKTTRSVASSERRQRRDPFLDGFNSDLSGNKKRRK